MDEARKGEETGLPDELEPADEAQPEDGAQPDGAQPEDEVKPAGVAGPAESVGPAAAADVRPAPGDRPHDPALLVKKTDVRPEAFLALDLRVGRILAVHPFPEARLPAWRLTVDFGSTIGTLRTSAQVTNYSESELVGRLVVGAINLGTKRIAGFDSEFLVLGALEPDGTVHLLEVSGPVAPGAPVA